MKDRITVLLVDDHALVRRGFKRLLEDDPAIVVVAEASDGEEAVRLAASLKPRVVVMDCAMPGSSGLVATRRILEQETAQSRRRTQPLDSSRATACDRRLREEPHASARSLIRSVWSGASDSRTSTS